MDKSYWFRLGLIVLMILGSIYILLPTVLQTSPQQRLASKAAGVDTTSTAKTEAPDLTVDVAYKGDPDAALERLQTVLADAQVPVDRVTKQQDHLRVVLQVGATPEQVTRALASGSTLKLYPFGDVVKATDLTNDQGAAPQVALPAGGMPDPVSGALDDQGVTWSQLQTLAGHLVPGGLKPLDATVSDLDVANPEAATAKATGVPADAGLLVVASDGAFRGVAWGTENALTLSAFSDDASQSALKQAADEGGLTIMQKKVASTATEDASTQKATDKPSKVPPWLEGLLPNTRMNLGLDLQGGIDLTLQVELEEAVLSQVSRDLTYLKEQAARDGITITSAKDDRTDPIITVKSKASLSELEKWFAKAMPQYQYVESLAGDTHVFQMKDDRQKKVEDQAVEQVLETLRKRVDATGVKEPSIVKKGGGRINVQLPGMVDLQQAIDAIGTTAVLEFRLVDEEFDESKLQQIITAAQDAMPKDQFENDQLLNEWLYQTKRLPEDRLILWQYEDTSDGAHKRQFPYVLKDVILTGNDVNNAGVAFDRNNLPYVALEFKPQGARVFCTVTTDNVHKRFAIILDGEVKSAPVIKEKICGGRASIEMGQSLDALHEAETLALVLRTGSLNAPVSVGQVRTVGATLGQDAIRSGGIATIIGSVLVLLFMWSWYRTAGLLANLALAVNVMLVLATLALFGATLTLPGIAGIALTIGMAVDANIIIYERIREELEIGQHARKAVDTGFEKGLSAILDSNITTAIAGVVLFSYGTGPIKGFAVTLLIGIITTVVSALFVNRTFLELLTRSSTARLKI